VQPHLCFIVCGPHTRLHYLAADLRQLPYRHRILRIRLCRRLLLVLLLLLLCACTVARCYRCCSRRLLLPISLLLLLLLLLSLHSRLLAALRCLHIPGLVLIQTFDTCIACSVSPWLILVRLLLLPLRLYTAT
jgi:hypothetical protein